MKRMMTLAMAAITIAVIFQNSLADDKPGETPPDFSVLTDCYHLPYSNRKEVDFNHLGSLHVRASINGGPVKSFDVDTGSNGVIVTASDVPNIDPNAPAGSITYTSSGVELDGVWTNATITFPDAKDKNGNVATAVVPVLAAKQRQFHPGAVNGGNRKATSAPVKNPRVAMLGIGFGRGKESHQERNPWVNLKEMQAGTMHPGYQITPDGIILGLTDETVGKGYVYEKLVERAATPSTLPGAKPSSFVKDWNSSQGWITVAGKKQQQSSILIDTGLTNLMIQFPEVKDQLQVDPGTEITVSLLSGKLSYSFKTGDTENPSAPRKVTWVHRDGSPAVNTGLRALAHFDYLYDADGGYLGLRPTGKK